MAKSILDLLGMARDCNKQMDAVVRQIRPTPTKLIGKSGAGDEQERKDNGQFGSGGGGSSSSKPVATTGNSNKIYSAKAELKKGDKVKIGIPSTTSGGEVRRISGTIKSINSKTGASVVVSSSGQEYRFKDDGRSQQSPDSRGRGSIKWIEHHGEDAQDEQERKSNGQFGSGGGGSSAGGSSGGAGISPGSLAQMKAKSRAALSNDPPRAQPKPTSKPTPKPAAKTGGSTKPPAASAVPRHASENHKRADVYLKQAQREGYNEGGAVNQAALNMQHSHGLHLVEATRIVREQHKANGPWTGPKG